MVMGSKKHVWVGLGLVVATTGIAGAAYFGMRADLDQSAPGAASLSTSLATSAPSQTSSTAPGPAPTEVASLPVNRSSLTGRWIDVAKGCAGTKLELRRNSYEGETLWDAYRVGAGVAEDRGDSGEWRVENGKLILTMQEFVEGDVSERPQAPPNTETMTIRNVTRDGFDEVFDYTGTDGISHQTWRRLRPGECESPA